MERKHLPFTQALRMAMYYNDKRLIMSIEKQELDMIFHKVVAKCMESLWMPNCIVDFIWTILTSHNKPME